MSLVPKPFPQEFRDDVIAVARRREAGVTLRQVADDFGMGQARLQNWLAKSDVETGRRPG
jgi:transposase-like protein